MEARDVVLRNSRIVAGIVIALFVAVVLVIGGVVYYDSVIRGGSRELGRIMDTYTERGATPEARDEAIDSLKKLYDSIPFGFARKMARYYLGNLYYDSEEYDRSIKWFEDFIDSPTKPLFHLLAWQKLALARAEAGEPRKALETLRELNEKFADSIIADQVYFHMGHLHSRLNNSQEARRYFSLVISEYSDSPYAGYSRKMLVLMDTDVQQGQAVKKP
jgi:tetratricopeptide (TPR) repeat protein